jgi:hypothetical protein
MGPREQESLEGWLYRRGHGSSAILTGEDDVHDEAVAILREEGLVAHRSRPRRLPALRPRT